MGRHNFGNILHYFHLRFGLDCECLLHFGFILFLVLLLLFLFISRSGFLKLGLLLHLLLLFPCVGILLLGLLGFLGSFGLDQLTFVDRHLNLRLFNHGIK